MPPFGSDQWLHCPRWVGWLVRYLDIYLFYVYGAEEASSTHTLGMLQQVVDE